MLESLFYRTCKTYKTWINLVVITTSRNTPRKSEVCRAIFFEIHFKEGLKLAP